MKFSHDAYEILKRICQIYIVKYIILNVDDGYLNFFGDTE